MTVNAEVLASAGLIRGDRAKPLKVLGQGEVSQKLFVAADAFSASARRKIEEAGGFVQLLAPEKAESRPRRSAERPEPRRRAPKAQRQRGSRRPTPTEAKPAREGSRARRRASAAPAEDARGKSDRACGASTAEEPRLAMSQSAHAVGRRKATRTPEASPVAVWRH